MSAVYILWLRQLKRYLRSRSRIIASLGQPLLFLLGMGFAFFLGPILIALSITLMFYTNL